MSIRTVTKGGPGKAASYREFQMDSTTDKDNLPTTVPNSDGEVADVDSKAWTKDYQHFYALGLDNVWREV